MPCHGKRTNGMCGMFDVSDVIEYVSMDMSLCRYRNVW